MPTDASSRARSTTCRSNRSTGAAAGLTAIGDRGRGPGLGGRPADPARLWLLSMGRLTGQSAPYQGMNVVGAAGFIVNGWWHGAIPSASLNVVWMLIGAFALVRLAGKAGRRVDRATCERLVSLALAPPPHRPHSEGRPRRAAAGRRKKLGPKRRIRRSGASRRGRLGVRRRRSAAQRRQADRWQSHFRRGLRQYGWACRSTPCCSSRSAVG